MSVVNKMLRDLDKREHAPSFSFTSTDYVAPQSSKGLWVIIVGLVLFGGVATSYCIYLINQSQVNVPSLHPRSVTQLQEADQYAGLNSTQQPVLSVPAKNTITKNDTETALTAVPVIKIEAKKELDDAIINVEPFTHAKKPKLATAQFNMSASDGAKTQLSTLRSRAHIASEQQNDSEVVSLLHEILLLAPDEIRTRKQLAALLFSSDQLSEAQAVLIQGIQQDPSDSGLRLMQSRILYKLGDNQTAFDVLSQHPIEAHANDELVSFRAALAEKIGQYGSAQQDYQVLVKRNPSEAKWWLGLGVSQDKQRLNKQAISSYQQAQSLNQLPQKVNSFVATRIQLLTRRS